MSKRILVFQVPVTRELSPDIEVTITKGDLDALSSRKDELEALLWEVWAKTESYRARMDYHMMLRGESKKAYEELKVRVEKALAEKPFKAGVLPYAPTKTICEEVDDGRVE